MQKRKNKLTICFVILLFSTGTTCMFAFNYYEDFIKPEKMSFSEMQLYNNELSIHTILGHTFLLKGYHFSIERNLYMIFYVLGIAMLIDYLGFWNIERIINKKIIKEKIKKEKNIYSMYKLS